MTIKNKLTAQKTKSEEIFDEREYIKAIGRRKSSTAQVRLYKDGKGRIYVNDLEYRKYFPQFELQKIVIRSLDLLKEKQLIDISVLVSGGGLRGQSEAISLGIARSLLKFDSTLKTKLRQSMYLTRDARIKERKKPGLKRARRAPQWQKR